MRVLRETVPVSESRRGRERVYRLEAATLYEVHRWVSPFGRFWRNRLTRQGDVPDTMEDAES